MNTLRTIGAELLGLFVDDWAFALLVIVWVCLFTALRARLPHTPITAMAFFAGLAVLTLTFTKKKSGPR